jgi:predicted amidohydrolase
VIDPYGRIMAECEDSAMEAVSADVDMDVLEAFRQKFPVLNDAD